MKRPTGKQALYAGIVVLGLGGAAVLLAPRRIPVEVATVTRGGVEVTVEEEGETRVRERYLVSAPIAGRIVRIELDPGDPVGAGETLVAILPSDPSMLDARSRAEAVAAEQAARGAAGEARARVEEARAQLRFSAADLVRVSELRAAGIVSQEQLESAQVTVERQREAVTAAEFRVRAAEGELAVQQARLRAYDLSRTGGAGGAGGAVPVLSPVGGVVLRVLRESAAVVPAGEPLLEVGDPAQLEIVADFLSSDAVRITPGQRVRIDRWGGGAALSGHVRRIEPSGFTKISALGVEEQRVNVVIDFDRPSGLGDGFRVEVAVVVEEQHDLLTVPASALFRRGESWQVFVVERGRAIERAVTMGARNAQLAAIVDGLAAGETVIPFPDPALRAGARVKRRRSAG